MYFYQSKKNYYRFPSKSRIEDYDSKFSYYFPEYNHNVSDNLTGIYPDDEDNDRDNQRNYYW